MDLASYRATRGLSLEQAGIELGLSSKGYLSRIESGRAPMPLRLALTIEQWSMGAVRALDIAEPADAALLRLALERARLPAGAAA